MKVLVLSTLIAVATATGIDAEMSSLLQSKRDSVTRADGVAPVLDRAADELRSLTSESNVADVMASFAKELSTMATSVLQMPPTETDALFKRASQTKELSNFVESYMNLPADVKQKVDDVALDTPIMNQVYDALDPVDSRALLVQLDRATTGKSCRQTIRDGQRVRECSSSSKNGRGGHTYTNWNGARGSGTETTTRDKEGDLVHQHTHKYTHDGRGGNARTETTTRGKDDYRHGHSTSHNIVNGRTITNSASGTTFHGGENTHATSHTHTHKAGEGTITQTDTTSTDSGGRTHSHGHSHAHNEDTGESRSVTTTCDGPGQAACDTIVTD